MNAIEKLPDRGEEVGWNLLREKLFEWLSTPLGATVTVSVIGGALVLWFVFKKT